MCACVYLPLPFLRSYSVALIIRHHVSTHEKKEAHTHNALTCVIKAAVPYLQVVLDHLVIDSNWAPSCDRTQMGVFYRMSGGHALL